MSSRRNTKTAKKVSTDSETDESDFEIQEGINDLMNLPIELLRKELINRKFQPTVINALPQWQLSAMLRESTSTVTDSFFSKIMGYQCYWRIPSRPAFTKQSINDLQKNESEEIKTKEEEENEESLDVDAKEFKKKRGWRKNDDNDDIDNSINPENYEQKIVDGQLKYVPKTLILDKVQKKDVPPEYVLPQVDECSVNPEPEKPSKPLQNNSQNQIIDDPDLIPPSVNTELLNYGVLQSSIDELSPDQIQKIREESKSKDFNAYNLISEYNLQTSQRILVEDSQFADTQTQIVEDSDKSNSESDESSDSDSDDDSDSETNSDKKSDNEEDEKEEDDHMNFRY